MIHLGSCVTEHCTAKVAPGSKQVHINNSNMKIKQLRLHSKHTSEDIRRYILRKIYGHNWFESVSLQVVDILDRENLHPLDSQTLRHNQKVTTSGSFQLPPFPSRCCTKVNKSFYRSVPTRSSKSVLLAQ